MSSLHLKGDVLTQRFRGISAEAGRISQEGTNWVLWLADPDPAERGRYQRAGEYASYEKAQNNVLANDALRISHMKWLQNLQDRQDPPIS